MLNCVKMKKRENLPCILGGTPYPGVDANEVYLSLLQGKRMEPPMHCPQEM